jgi:hypothetical protein
VEQHITSIIHHMMSSQQQMARLLEAERHIVGHMAHIVHDIPDRNPSFSGAEAIIKNSGELTKTISAYLMSLAYLEEAIAENLTCVMKELNREEAYLSMLNATAKMQYNISLILEAKALEAEKTKHWLCSHLEGSSFNGHEEQLIQAVAIHLQIVDVIDGLTKLENELGKNLKIILDQDEDSESGGFGGGNGLFGLGGQS